MLIEYHLNQRFASLAALGFDGSVHVHAGRVEWSGKKRVLSPLQWRFDLGDERYVTMGPPLSTTSTLALLSRGTRVYRVQRLKDNGKPDGQNLVLKDFNPWESTNYEYEIQEDICNRLKERGSSEAEVNELRNHFLTIICEQSVTTQDGIAGASEGLSPALPQGWKLAQWAAGETSKSAPSPPADRDLLRGPRAHTSSSSPFLTRRRHRRILFKELCTTVYELNNYGTVSKCLNGFVNGVFRGFLSHLY